jgi:hypothetical protein
MMPHLPSITFVPVVPLLLLALAGVVLLAADVLPLRRAASVSPVRRILVAVFSAAAIATALLPLAGPVRESRERAPSEGAILIDASRSMATEDGASGRSRYASAVEIGRAIEDANPATRWRTLRFPPGTGAAAGDGGTDAPGGLTSPLGEAIARAEGAGAEDSPQAVILLSDGADTGGRDPVAAARDARARGATVFAVSLGSSTRSPPPRIARVEIAAPERVALGAVASVRVSADLEGLDGAPVEAELLEDGVRVGTVPLAVNELHAHREARFEVALKAEGLHALEARVRSGSREARASRRLRVVAMPIEVALIDAPARWEHRYFRRALEDSPRIHLTRVELWSLESEAPATSGLAALAAIASADVIVLGDLPRRALPPVVGAAIRERVDQSGAGLLVLGGRQGLAGVLDIGLAPVLPIEVPEDASPIARAFRPAETDAGRPFLGAALALDESAVHDALQHLPPFTTFVPLGAPRPGASVLLESPGRHALLVVGRFGLGRTGVLATDETWRWAFQPAGGRPSPQDAHRALVRELVLSLAARDAGLETPLAIGLARECFSPGDVIPLSVACASSAATTLSAELEDATGKPVASAATNRAGADAVPFALALPREVAGTELVLRAIARDARGAELARDERVVTLLAPERTDEVGEPSRPDLLARIADAGGGAAFAEDAVSRGDALRAIAKALEPARPDVRRTEPLTAGPGYVAVLALLLSATWGLRRGAGLR